MKKQYGLSLVELMVSMVLGLILMGGVIQLVTSSQTAYREVVVQARMQETAKLALDYVVRDLRNVAYWGCLDTNILIANTLTLASTDFFRPQNPLTGWESNELLAGSDYIDAVIGSDIIEFRVIDIDGGYTLKNTPSVGSVNIELNDKVTRDAGTIWAIVEKDCSNMAVFAQSLLANDTPTLTHDLTATATATNCTANMKGHFDCSNIPGSSATAYNKGSAVFEVMKVAYLITDNSPSGQRALYRRTPSFAGDDQQEELIQGIEDLQFIYGIDTTGDNAVDRFADAKTINDAFADTNGDGLCDPGGLCFSDVLTIRVEVTVSPLNDDSGGIPNQTFSTSIRLRNRGISS